MNGDKEQLMLVILMKKIFSNYTRKAFERDLRRGGKSVGRELLIHQYKLWLQITKQKYIFLTIIYPKL